MKQSILLFAIFGVLAQFVGCSFPPKIYRIDIRQGNYITPEMIAKIKKGQTKQQIIEILGTPALEHFFEKDRWDYFYSYKPGNGDPMVKKHLVLHFKGQTLQRFESID